MNLESLYSTVAVLNYIGAVCNDTSLIIDKSKRLIVNKDLELSRMHKILYAAVENIFLNGDVKEIDSTAIDMYLSAFPQQHEFFKQNKGIELVEQIKINAKNISFEYSLRTIKKLTLLREYEKVGFNTSFIYDVTVVDPTEMAEQRRKFDELDELDIRNKVKEKIDTIHEKMAIDTADAYSFHAGDGILDLIKRCKEEPTWGYSFQSLLFNRAFRGLLPKKVMIRSASSGSGKSRMSIGDMCNVSAKAMFNNETRQWEENTDTVPSLFITTELDKDEVQLVMLATISGVPEDIIKDGEYTEEVEQRIIAAGEIIQESPIFIEFTTDFSQTDLECLIEKNLNKYGTGFVFFDYIQITPAFAREVRKAFGYDLREDQMLNLLVSCLKNLANKYSLFILTSTQLNRSHKTDEYPDATHLRGGTATADKCDFGVITMKVTKREKEKLERIMQEEGFEHCPIPTHGHHIFKNRGGKYTSVILWVNMNLDNMRIKDCFATTQDFEQIYIEPKILK